MKGYVPIKICTLVLCYRGKDGYRIRKNNDLIGITGRYSLLKELGYRAHALFHHENVTGIEISSHEYSPGRKIY